MQPRARSGIRLPGDRLRVKRRHSEELWCGGWLVFVDAISELNQMSNEAGIWVSNAADVLDAL